MAYMNQERKKELAPKIKEICNKYGIKASLGVRHHSTLVLNIQSGPIDFIKNRYEVACLKPQSFGRYQNIEEMKNETYLDVNKYHYKESFTGKALNFLNELIPAMEKGNWDRSDSMTDYFDVGWYIDINIGTWEKPYILNGAHA